MLGHTSNKWQGKKKFKPKSAWFQKLLWARPLHSPNSQSWRMLWLPSKRNLATADMSLSCQPATLPKGSALCHHLPPKQETLADCRTAHCLLSPSRPAHMPWNPSAVSSSPLTELKFWFQSLVPLPYMVKSYLSVHLRSVFDHDGAVWLSNIYLFPWWPLRQKYYLFTGMVSQKTFFFTSSKTGG